MKRIASLFLSLACAAALVLPANAADAQVGGTQHSITIDNAVQGHTYEVYQIFSVDLSADGTVVSNVQWGSGVRQDQVQRALGSAADWVKKLQNESDARDFSNAVQTYLDSAKCVRIVYSNGQYTAGGLESGYYLIKDQDGTVQNHDAYTQYIMQVVGDVRVKPKSDVPTIVKKVQDVNDAAGDVSAWQDSADHDIGDHVPFQLTVTLPSNLSAYHNGYQMTCYDTLAEGFSFDLGSLSVKLGEQDVTGHFQIGFTEGVQGQLRIACDDVKALGALDRSVITIAYTATLNDKAKIGAEGNVNEVYLEYSNNPNPGAEAQTGKTPVDQVKVFTYEVVINKVDEQGIPLTGAGFTLYKKNNGETASGGFVKVGEPQLLNNGTTFSWKGLDDGVYRLEESKTPDGYNTMPPKEFEITAEHETDADDPKLTRLDTGVDFASDLSAGTLTAQIKNKKGMRLPSTGGVGAVAFYAAGSLLIVGSGAALLRAKRKGSQQD